MTDQQLLEIAREKQTEFWEALLALETQLGIEIDGAKDLQECDIDTLTADDDDEDEEYTCNGCGRAEDVCSADPCPSVIRDRES